MAIIQNKPNMNYGVWGSNGNIAVPTSEKVDLGWIIERPPNEVMNWLQNRQDSMLQFINQRGIPTWDSLTEYPVNAYVVRGVTLYRAVSQNIDKDPSLNSAIWNVAFATYTDYSNLYNEVQSVKGVEGYLDLYVSKNNPVMLGESKGVGYKDSTGVSGLTFSGTTPQIIQNNYVVAEFTGTESNNDVVTFSRLREYLQIYKVGDLYLTTNSANPSTTLGYGTWTRHAEGRAVVGFSSSTSSAIPEWTKAVDSTYGTYTHKLTVDEMPRHSHGIKEETGDSTGGGGSVDTSSQTVAPVNLTMIQEAGGSVEHNNVQPSIVVFIWRRTA